VLCNVTALKNLSLGSTEAAAQLQRQAGTMRGYPCSPRYTLFGDNFPRYSIAGQVVARGATSLPIAKLSIIASLSSVLKCFSAENAQAKKSLLLPSKLESRKVNG
jgi:hypothetical protein